MIIPWLKIGGVVGVAAVVWFGYLYVTNLQQKVIDLEKNITTLEIVVDKKNEELTKKAIEAAEVRAEVVFLQERDIQKSKNINILTEEVKSSKRKTKLENAIIGRPSLLLKIVNKSVTCETLHFEDFNGKCVNGSWRKEK